MTTTRVFKSGNSQAVRLPKEFSVNSKVLEIFRRGNEIVLREPCEGLTRAFELLAELPDDFLLTAAKTFLPSRARGCDGPALSSKHEYLHLHPAAEAGE
jgi:antitoxin VapB